MATLELSLVTAHKRVIRAEGEATLSREELRSHSLAIAGLEAEVSESVARWEQETLLRMQAEESARGLEQRAHQALANEAAALKAVDEGVAAQQVLLKQIGQLRELKVASRQLKVCSLCPGCDGRAAELCTDVPAVCKLPYMLQRGLHTCSCHIARTDQVASHPSLDAGQCTVTERALPTLLPTLRCVPHRWHLNMAQISRLRLQSPRGRSNHPSLGAHDRYSMAAIGPVPALLFPADNRTLAPLRKAL